MAPGWYVDPFTDPSLLRFWDGFQWTDQVMSSQPAYTYQQNPYQQPVLPSPGNYSAPFNPYDSARPTQTQQNYASQRPYNQAQPHTNYQQPPRLQEPPAQVYSDPAYAMKQSDRTLRLIAFILSLLSVIGFFFAGIAMLFMPALFLPLYSSASATYLALASLSLTAIAIGCFIPLIWFLPMTIHMFSLYKGRKPNTVFFGVMTLLFVGLIPGILLLCSTKD